jgi:GMP synthase-like glutamine amidotransferase
VRAPILSLIHQTNAGSGVFGEVVRGCCELDERCIPRGDPAPDPEDYGAVLVFGASANVDEEEAHPWLRTERALLERALEVDTPVLGVCLGAQQLAQAAGARVGPIGEFEIGWRTVHATPEAASDAVLGALPATLRACEWHGYGFELPPGAVALYRNDRGLQAFRIGARQWGIQFHAEVTESTFAGWAADDEGRSEALAAGVDLGALAADTGRLIEGWNELGHGLCRRFLAVAGALR